MHIPKFLKRKYTIFANKRHTRLWPRYLNYCAETNCKACTVLPSIVKIALIAMSSSILLLELRLMAISYVDTLTNSYWSPIVAVAI